MTVSEDEWDALFKKYSRLMYHITHRIGGDRVVFDYDDCQQDLRMIAMDAVATYTKKTNKTFSEFFNTTEFDKYIKTCLWNKKNNTGAKITKKAKIRQCVSLSENPELFSTGSGSTYASSSLETGAPTVSAFEDIELDSIASNIVTAVMEDMKIIKPDGSLNVSKLARRLKVSKHEVNSALSRLQQSLQDYND